MSPMGLRVRVRVNFSQRNRLLGGEESSSIEKPQQRKVLRLLQHATPTGLAVEGDVCMLLGVAFFRIKPLLLLGHLN